MVVAVAPPASGSGAPIFVFADEAALQGNAQWQECLEQCGGAEPVLVPSPTAQGAQAVQEARVVVLGGKCKALSRWRKADLAAALAACHAAGGVIAAVGPVGTLLGAWYRGEGRAAQEGWGLLPRAVVYVCTCKADRRLCEDVTAGLHGAGHEDVKGYAIADAAGAVFFRSGDGCRAEPIGQALTEISAVPKAGTLGKVIQLRKLPVPDPAIRAALRPAPGERWRDALDLAAEWLVAAQGTAVVSTGAGISAESGIPTYRDPGGLWELYNQMEVSHIKGFARDPLKCWRFELELHQLLKHCGPNAGHRALQRLEQAGVLRAVVTQNVDGLHLAAGSKCVLEIHGSETRGICMRSGCRSTAPYADVFRGLGWVDAAGATTAAAPPLPARKASRAEGGIYAELTDSDSSESCGSDTDSSDGSTSYGTSSDDASTTSSELKRKVAKGPEKFDAVVRKLRRTTTDAEALAKMDQGPRCAVCGEGLLKPDAVYFGESLPPETIQEALKVSRAAKAFIIVGTSGQVAPACKLPLIAKAKAAAKVIEISPRETDMSSDADLLLLGTSATVLPALVEAVMRRLEGPEDGDVPAAGAKRRRKSVAGRRGSGGPLCK